MPISTTPKELEDKLTEAEENFIELVLLNEGNVAKAARDIGITATHAYRLRKRLAKHIIQATHEYLAMHAPKAANRVIGSIDEELPNPTRLSAAFGLLDRVGVNQKDKQEEKPVLKQNIFILPEKSKAIVLDAEDYYVEEKS